MEEGAVRVGRTNEMKIFITGGAGFIGCNCAARFLNEGHDVVVFDNLSRFGSEANLDWLKSKGEFRFIKGDIRDFQALKSYFKENPETEAVIHLAAQTAVTTSIENPREDFDVNALGTLNLLEAVKLCKGDPAVIYSSTNKVYGSLDHLKVALNGSRYELVDLPNGISENAPLDFHSPYGCSKGAADQYVMDYHRMYGLRTVVFRQSCIYGPRQFGVEDQGWVAWFIISAVRGDPLTIYGDGRQVRDVLEITDLIQAFEQAIERVDVAQGAVYNIGGGRENRLSLLELVQMIEHRLGRKIPYRFDSWRAGDQKVYVSDIGKCKDELGWEPRISVKDGFEKLYAWSCERFAGD
jgi:CDP-paratose 2-epimerase